MELTENDLTDYLAAHPDFFERHAELLAGLQLQSPHGNRAVSLQERQMEMLRDKMRGLEHRLTAMMRNAADNEALSSRLLQWARALLLAHQGDPAQMPQALQAALQTTFELPLTALKLWPIRPEFAHHDFAGGVSDDIRTFAASLAAPFCGPNAGFEAANWLSDPQLAQSVALVALRQAQSGQCIGLLVLGSPDPQRFTADMATDFLAQIGQLASAAVQGLVAA